VAPGTARGPPPLFPWDRTTPARAATPTQTANEGTADAGGTEQPAAVAGTPAPAAPGRQRGTPPPQDSDEPQGPPLGAGGILPGGERKPSAAPPRPPRLVGNRDWVIPIECRADAVVLRSAGQKFAPPPSGNAATGPDPLAQALKQMIARRQASVRPGELPYRPQARLLVYPDGLRTYYLVCAALEPLGIPLTRQNVAADPPAHPAP
jgi:hypothetical protein